MSNNANNGAGGGGASGGASLDAKTQRAIMEKEIDLIQACITRMAQNSFLIKGWIITLSAALLGLASEKTDMRLLCVLLMLATVCFWYLDAFYLRLERLYRAKYNWVIQHRMTSSDYQYDLNPANTNTRIADAETNRLLQSVWRVMFSESMWPLYVVILLTLLCVMIWPTVMECLKTLGNTASSVPPVVAS